MKTCSETSVRAVLPGEHRGSSPQRVLGEPAAFGGGSHKDSTKRRVPVFGLALTSATTRLFYRNSAVAVRKKAVGRCDFPFPGSRARFFGTSGIDRQPTTLGLPSSEMIVKVDSWGNLLDNAQAEPSCSVPMREPGGGRG